MRAITNFVFPIPIKKIKKKDLSARGVAPHGTSECDGENTLFGLRQTNNMPRRADNIWKQIQKFSVWSIPEQYASLVLYGEESIRSRKMVRFAGYSSAEIH